MPSKSPSIVGRAVAALLLTIAFYGLAILIAGTVLAIPVLEVMYAHRLHVKLAIGCVLAGLAILAAIWPRFDRFEAPGIRLQPQDQPRLFELIERVAGQAGQGVPAEVYLVPEVNAFVAERGGFLGLGSRRVMGVGLPLLQAMNVSQFLGVIAHEFGHFHGGDTKLGRWVYKTHAAIMRTLVNLQESLLQKPFIWYAKLFLWITNTISRQQEYAADAFAVQIAGRKPFAEGLRKVHGIAPAFDAYWQSEVVPVLSSGYRAQIAAGFGQFLANPTIAGRIQELVQTQEKEEKTERYDTHPALADRLAAIEKVPEKVVPENTQRAIDLLGRVDELEASLLQFQFGEPAAKLKMIPWQAVGHDVYLPSWRETVQEYREPLQGVTIDQLPTLLETSVIRNRLASTQGEAALTTEQQQAAEEHVLGAALALSLASHGWQIQALPGADIELTRDRRSVAPFREVHGWRENGAAAAAWSSRCRELGLVGLPVLAQG